MSVKLRLDALLVEKGLCQSRERAKTTIMSGNVYVNGQKAEKPGHEVAVDALIDVRHDPIGYVSRGGLKLEKALDSFNIDVKALNILDCGASTGGFTDCMLKRGAEHVWAIDVGYGQLAWSLRNDPRVTCMERTNLRHVTLEQIGQPADMAVMDLSFISLALVLPVVDKLLKNNSKVICLVKPQFEAGREQVGKNGVIRDPEVHCEVLRCFAEAAESNGYYVNQITFSPIKGPKGNIEFLVLLEKECGIENSFDWQKIVAKAHSELKGDDLYE